MKDKKAKKKRKWKRKKTKTKRKLKGRRKWSRRRKGRKKGNQQNKKTMKRNKRKTKWRKKNNSNTTKRKEIIQYLAILIQLIRGARRMMKKWKKNPVYTFVALFIGTRGGTCLCRVDAIGETNTRAGWSRTQWARIILMTPWISIDAKLDGIQHIFAFGRSNHRGADFNVVLLRDNDCWFVMKGTDKYIALSFAHARTHAHTNTTESRVEELNRREGSE